MTKKIYIKPATTFIEIKESISLLAGSGEGPEAPATTENDEINFQSKGHYNLWEDEDEEDW